MWGKHTQLPNAEFCPGGEHASYGMREAETLCVYLPSPICNGVGAGEKLPEGLGTGIGASQGQGVKDLPGKMSTKKSFRNLCIFLEPLGKWKIIKFVKSLSFEVAKTLCQVEVGANPPEAFIKFVFPASWK